MDVQDYFDFMDDGNIRIEGHRIYIDNVLTNYFCPEGPAELQCRYPHMSMQKIYSKAEKAKHLHALPQDTT